MLPAAQPDGIVDVCHNSLAPVWGGVKSAGKPVREGERGASAP